MHSALASLLVKMLEEGVPVETEEGITYRHPTAAELGVAVAFLKNNSITADIEDNDELTQLAERLRAKSKSRTIVPVFEDVTQWQ